MEYIHKSIVLQVLNMKAEEEGKDQGQGRKGIKEDKDGGNIRQKRTTV